MRVKKVFTVRVPASSGNLGPGFDVLGMALALTNEVRVEVLNRKFAPPQIEIRGEGESSISKGPSNLVFQALLFVLKKAKKPVPALKLFCRNRIPLARGLGSSSAALLAGLLAGNEILGRRFSRSEILNFANELEGHPDNVASSLLGGVQASKVVNGHVIAAAWPAPKASFMAAVPEFQLSTKRARKAVPQKWGRSQSISNLASVSLMPVAFSSHPELLRVVLDDAWHEPYRAKLIPGFHRVRQAAIRAGAYGMTLSGAGPTLLAWTPSAKKRAVGRAMEAAFRRSGVRCKILNLNLDRKGAFVK